jgi:outer membrane scaffolding protein for murein synthesis (MipA/OmpV family)
MAGIITSRQWRKNGFLPYAILAVLLPQGASAEDADSKAASTWVVTLGASVEQGPDYPGASHHGLSYTPSFDIRRLSDPDEYSPPDDNISLDVVNLGNFSAGPVIGFRDSRSPSDDRRLAGLQRINWDVDAGLAARYWIVPDRARAHVELRQAVSNDSGFVADLGLDYFHPLSEDLVISAGVRASLANGAYMQRYFGVSAADAARNGTVASFDADPGLKSVGFVVSASYAITPEWTAQVYDRFDRLTGDAANSPITSTFGNPNQNVIGISLSKSFNINF